MAIQTVTERLDYLTFKCNLEHSRYGWLRLTPAHSIHLISVLLDTASCEEPIVLDPFCGTGTTALACAERGIECDTTDINPFLLWLSRAKTYSYDNDDLAAFKASSGKVVEAMRATDCTPTWLPPLHQIEKWWDEDVLNSLARAISEIRELEKCLPEGACNLLKIAFCRTMIEHANVSFGHQSMSFNKKKEMRRFFLETQEDLVIESWERSVSLLLKSASTDMSRTPCIVLQDARKLSEGLQTNRYSLVVTSPPYPNRMSYIRELRPYMYWLDYLDNGRDAGELDWQAIGGTWGCATSNLNRWDPNPQIKIPFDDFYELLANIATHSPLLARYVHKYFEDMFVHCRELFTVVRPRGTIHYIVGNSKFYDVLLPVEAIFASLFQAAGFVDTDIRVIRKRSSKKEMFEFVVSARKP